MKKVRTAICTGITALALSFSGCSNLIYDVSNQSTVSASRSVLVNESLSIDSSIPIPFVRLSTAMLLTLSQMLTGTMLLHIIMLVHATTSQSSGMITANAVALHTAFL